MKKFWFSLLCLGLSACVGAIGPVGPKGDQGEMGKPGRDSADGHMLLNSLKTNGCIPRDFIMLVCMNGEVNKTRPASGSAVVIENGKIVTAKHVADVCTDGSGFIVYADEMVGLFTLADAQDAYHDDEVTDITMITPEWMPGYTVKSGCKLATAEQAHVQMGDDVMSLGYPGFTLGNLLFRKEYVVALNDKEVVMNGEWMPGTSGSPVFNMQGQMIGVVVKSAIKVADIGIYARITDVTWKPYVRSEVKPKEQH